VAHQLVSFLRSVFCSVFKTGLFWVGFLAWPWPSPAVHAEGSAETHGSNGALIYEKHCSECHGKQGEGVHGKYDEILAGNRTVASLSRLISKT